MKTKFKNKLRYIAAGIFLLGLIVNVSLSLTDPFVHVGAELLAGTSGSSSGSAGICCGELDASCRHPDGMIFADATWISDATNCNGHECPECPA